MANASACTRCGRNFSDIDGKLSHVSENGDPISVKDCDSPVPGATKFGAMRHVHSGTINGDKVDIYVPDSV